MAGLVRQPKEVKVTFDSEEFKKFSEEITKLTENLEKSAEKALLAAEKSKAATRELLKALDKVDRVKRQAIVNRSHS